MNLQEEEIFFENPESNPCPPGEFGILYLLRRDIKRCMDMNILWPGAMCILAGVDLLGKFLDGTDDHRSVGNRFRLFIVRYFGLTSSSDGEVIYQLRNSLLHSFGLFSKNSNGQEYHFQLDTTNSAKLIVQLPPDSYRINLIELQKRFESAVKEYRQDLSTDPKLQAKFDSMFRKYGKTSIT